MTMENLRESAAFLQKKTALRPKLAFVLGSGLSGFADKVEGAVRIRYSDIPHFAASTVEGHPGQLVLGTLAGVPVALMQGRLHAYEGLTQQQVVFPLRTLAQFGVTHLLLTNAAGGLNPKMKPGDFMVLRDHMNLTGANPLVGANLPVGPRFPDMTEPYDKKLNKLLLAGLKKAKARVHQGVYVGVLGPTYETAAEIRFYRKIGGDAVGMSTVAETIAARHAGLHVAALSCITNLGTGLSQVKLSHEDVKDVADRAANKFTLALLEFTKSLASEL